MELREFHNTIRKLFNVDHSAVPWMSEDDWPKFRDDPVRFFIKANDETADLLWAVICPVVGVIKEDAITELHQCASMIRTWIPEVYPANSLGQVSFARSVMESVATAIERAINKEPV